MTTTTTMLDEQARGPMSLLRRVVLRLPHPVEPMIQAEWECRIAPRLREELHRPDLGPCLIWTGYVDENGYGCVRHRGRHTALLHRISYTLHVGPISEDEPDVLHRCDNPPCVRPEHLFAGTHAGNVADMVQKDRHARGERHPAANLTEANVLEARRLYLAGNATFEMLARKYAVRVTTIHLAITGRTWRHLIQDRVSGDLIRRGEHSRSAKLTWANVAAIRAHYRAGNVSMRALARVFRVDQHTVRDIIHGRTWTRVQDTSGAVA